MNPTQLLLVVRARYKVALVVAFLTIAAVMAARELMSKQYTAETSLVVDVRSSDPVASLLLPATMMPGNLGTQVDIIKSDRVARKVVRMLQLDQNPTARQSWQDGTGGRVKLEDWLAERLKRNLVVTPARDSNFVGIAFRGSDPAFVAAVANAYAQAYVDVSIELKVEPARQYSRWFGDQAKVLRENVEKAQATLSDFQRQNGIVGNGENLDYESAKLSDLSAKLTVAQAETAEARSKQRSSALETLPEVQQNPTIARLRSEIALLEGRLKDAAGNLGSNHPQYQRGESELAVLRSRLEVETRLIASGFTSTGSVGVSRQADLQAAIQAQKKKILDLRGKYDELAVLARDVETAKKAYEAVINRLNQTNLESQSTQTNVTILTPAVEPLLPSSPKPREVMLLLAIAAGAFLGAISVFALEMLDRRVRSTHDLADMLQIPVLGVIERARKPGRIALLRHRVALLTE